MFGATIKEMNIIVKIFSLLLLIVVGNNSFAQSIKLTKTEMYRDFDTLVYHLNATSPHIVIKKDMWHYDANKQWQALRTTIDTISSNESFALLLRRALFAAQDEHTSLLSDEDHYEEKSREFRLYLPVSYQAGKYLVARSFIAGPDTVRAGSEIIAMEGEKVNRYLNKHISDIDYSYDLGRKQFYSTGFYKNAATLYQHNIHLAIKQRHRKSQEVSLPVTERLQFVNPIMDTIKGIKVDYWHDEKVLYIKLYLMEPGFISRFKPQIYRYKDSAINRVIIDLRGNGGGSDTTWQSLYACLLPRPVSYELKIDGYNPSQLQADYLQNAGIRTQDVKKDTDRLLRKYHFYTWANATQTLAPSDSSIRFKGKIIVLGEDIYSSAGSAFIIPNASAEDSIYSVGRETGMFLGVGYSPVVFELPNSKIRFRVAPSLEVTDASKLTDLMHDRYDFVVPGTKEELIRRDTFKGNTLGRYYLQHFDPFIQKAMAL